MKKFKSKVNLKSLTLTALATISLATTAMANTTGSGAIPLTSASESKLTTTATTTKESTVPDIYFDGDLYKFPSGYSPVMRNGRILVPIKSAIFAEVGAESSYDIINREVTIKTKNHLLATYIQELDWYDAGIRTYISDVRSDLISDEVYVPLRVVLECLGYEVDYQQSYTENSKVYIK